MQNEHAEKLLKEEKEKSERMLKVFNDTKKALETEERFVNFFKTYNASSVESFITYYAHQKSYWSAYGDSNLHYKNQRNNHWRDAAIDALKGIFEKKLFDLKCRWIAGEMDLPGIEASHDFGLWFAEPASCSAVEPITEEELNCCIAYHESREDDDEHDEPTAYIALHHYHHHRSISMNEFDDDEYIPPWFSFYDKHFGTGGLLKLPNTRMDMECDYHDIWSEHIFYLTLTEAQRNTIGPFLNRAKRMELRKDKAKHDAFIEESNRRYEEQHKNMPKYEHMHVYDRKKMKELVALIETPEMQKYYRATREWNDRRSRNESIEVPIIYMREAKEWIPVQAHSDFREAIKEAYAAHGKKKLLELLPVVYAEYMEAVVSKKPFNWNRKEDTHSRASANEMKERLLAAREWKGEPRNLDFLKKENLHHDRA